MTWRMAGRLALVGGVLFLTGCSVLPGMEFDGSVPERETWAGTSTKQYDVTPITPRLLRQMMVARKSSGIGRGNPELETELASYIYRVEPRDTLAITIWGGSGATFAPVAVSGGPASSLSSAIAGLTGMGGQSPSNAQAPGFDVAPDGTIYFPYLGRVDVAGLTTEEISEKLSGLLTRIVKQPQITVSVLSYNSQKFQLTGAVEKPGLYPITNLPLTVSQAISLAGGITGNQTSAPSSSGSGQHSGDLSRVVYIHKNVSQTLNIRNVLQYGDTDQDRLIRPGDIVFVPDAASSQVHVLGEVKAPGNYAMPNGKLNLTQVLGDAGGMDLTTANTARIFVFRGSYARPKIYWLDASSPDAMLLGNEFELHSQDVVYVATASLVSWDRFLSQLLPTIQAMYFTRALTK